MQTPKKLFIGFIIIFALACNKDKFKDVPQIKIDKINPSTGIIKRSATGAGNELSIDIEFTDKQGDVNDTLWIKKIRRNVRPLPVGSPQSIYDGIKEKIPDFPNNTKGIIRYTFDFNNQLALFRPENDTVYFRFMVKDKKGNKSDTLNTRDIIIGF